MEKNTSEEPIESKEVVTKKKNREQARNRYWVTRRCCSICSGKYSISTYTAHILTKKHNKAIGILLGDKRGRTASCSF